MSKTSSPGALREEFRTIIITLLQKGHTISLKRLNQTGLRRHCFWWKLDDSVSLDVFPGAFVDGKYCRPTFVETNLVYDDLFPLKEKMLRGYKVLVPNDYERKLAAVYGPSWRIPDPFWAKTRSEFILRYLESIRMTREDLELVAKNSLVEADFIRNYLRENNF